MHLWQKNIEFNHAFEKSGKFYIRTTQPGTISYLDALNTNSKLSRIKFKVSFTSVDAENMKMEIKKSRGKYTNRIRRIYLGK